MEERTWACNENALDDLEKKAIVDDVTNLIDSFVPSPY